MMGEIRKRGWDRDKCTPSAVARGEKFLKVRLAMTEDELNTLYI